MVSLFQHSNPAQARRGILTSVNFLSPEKRVLFPANSNHGRIFLTLTLVYLLAISSLLRANVDYLDDARRKADGFPGWDSFSRYLSDILSKLINTNSYLADISPLTQIIAVLLISLASLLFIVTFTRDSKISWFSVVAVLPLGISPYFLECLSYKFDAPFMALSLLCSILPFLWIHENTLLYLVTVILCTLVICTTYQASLGIFPISILFFLFLRWQRRENDKKDITVFFSSVGGYLIGVLFFKIFLMKSFDSYVDSTMFPLKELPLGVVRNICTYLQHVYTDFDNKWIIFIAVLCVCYWLHMILTTKRNRLLTAILAFLCLLVTLCLCFGVYISFESPLFECRAMYGFGAWIAILALLSTEGSAKSTLPSLVAKIVSFCLSWCFFVFAFVYGNALGTQQEYINFRMETLLSDLNQTAEFANCDSINIQINGSIGQSPILENMPQYQGVLHRLVPTTFAGTWQWDSYRFYHYYDLQNITVVSDLEAENLPVLFDGYYDTIQGSGNTFLITLKDH